MLQRTESRPADQRTLPLPFITPVNSH